MIAAMSVPPYDRWFVIEWIDAPMEPEVKRIRNLVRLTGKRVREEGHKESGDASQEEDNFIKAYGKTEREGKTRRASPLDLQSSGFLFNQGMK